MNDRIFTSLKEKELCALATQLAQNCLKLAVNQLAFYLIGPLGVGKSRFMRAYLAALGWQGAVPSPSFSLIETYALAPFTVTHCDLYRLSDPSELWDLGLAELYRSGQVLAIEWPEIGLEVLPKPDLVFDLSFESDAARRVKVTSQSCLGDQLLTFMS